VYALCFDALAVIVCML